MINLIQEKRVARHLHLPLQSGSAAVLRRMARANTPAQYADLVNRIREVVPDIALTTDIMTGFPGESDAEFAESLDFVRQMEFADGHVFTYSAREGTPAAEFPDQVPHQVRKQRSAQIRDLLASGAVTFHEKFVGSELITLWEQVEGRTEGLPKVIGLTDNYIRVEVCASADIWNSFSTVRITGLTASGAKGDIRLRLLSRNSMEVNWWTIELGTGTSLVSGTAVLTRRKQP